VSDALPYGGTNANPYQWKDSDNLFVEAGWSMTPEQAKALVAELELARRSSSNARSIHRRAVTPLIVAVERMRHDWAESDDAHRRTLWANVMGAADELAERYGVWPLEGEPQ
jgi:hypothetical protein